jgi:hypothetical protein
MPQATDDDIVGVVVLLMMMFLLDENVEYFLMSCQRLEMHNEMVYTKAYALSLRPNVCYGECGLFVERTSAKGVMV